MASNKSWHDVLSFWCLEVWPKNLAQVSTKILQNFTIFLLNLQSDVYRIVKMNVLKMNNKIIEKGEEKE